MKNEPRLEWMDLVGALLIYIGALLFLVVLHVLSLNYTGAASDVLRTVFIVYLWVYIGLVIFGFIGVLIQIFRWLTYKATTPVWEQRKG